MNSPTNKSRGKVPGIRKIAVLRANALGDFLFTLPALEALRHTYSEAEIVLLAKEWHRAFLAGRPSPVDRVVVIPPYAGVSVEHESQEDQGTLERFFQEMKQEHFDLALQLQGGGRYSNPFVSKLQAGLTVGLKAPEASELDRWVPYFYFQSEIMRFLEVASLVGAGVVTVNPHILVTEEDRAESLRIVNEDERPLVALHVGASDVRRRWSPRKFARVGDVLVAQGARIVLTGVQEEADIVAQVQDTMEFPVDNVCGQLSLNGLTGLFSRCRLVISNDTGSLHLAYALETPSIGLYWAYNALTGEEPMRSTHRPLISWQMTCPVCGKDNSWGRCEHQVSFIDDIKEEDVLTQVNAMDLF